jgi:hypothetical protein
MCVHRQTEFHVLHIHIDNSYVFSLLRRIGQSGYSVAHHVYLVSIVHIDFFIVVERLIKPADCNWSNKVFSLRGCRCWLTCHYSASEVFGQVWDAPLSTRLLLFGLGPSLAIEQTTTTCSHRFIASRYDRWRILLKHNVHAIIWSSASGCSHDIASFHKTVHSRVCLVGRQTHKTLRSFLCKYVNGEKASMSVALICRSALTSRKASFSHEARIPHASRPFFDSIASLVCIPRVCVREREKKR